MDFEKCKTIGDLIETLKAKYDLDHKINEIIQGDSDIMGLHLNISFNNDGELSNDFWGCMDCLCNPCEFDCHDYHYVDKGYDKFGHEEQCRFCCQKGCNGSCPDETDDDINDDDWYDNDDLTSCLPYPSTDGIKHYGIDGVAVIGKQVTCFTGEYEEAEDYLFHNENYDGLYIQDVKDCPFCNPDYDSTI